MTGWVARTFFTERGLLRFGLYLILLVSVTHVVAIRYLAFEAGMSPAMPWGLGARGFNMGPPEGFVGMVLTVTLTILGPWCAEFAPLIMILCLAVLAATTRAGRPRIRRAHPFEEGIALKAVPHETEPSPPPARHPLDPDPTDSPLSPRWPKTSPPSR